MSQCDLACADQAGEYARLMSEDVSSLEAVKRRVSAAAGSTVGGLAALNATANEIEARSAAAVNTSQQASQVTVDHQFSVPCFC